MKPGLLLTLLLLSPAFWAEGQLGDNPEPGSRIITGEMIRRAGVTRIAELLLLVNEWNINSTEGFTWKASPNGLAPFQGQNWIVMVDGQRVDLNSFDIKNLYMLPVALDQIAYVEVISTPRLYEGEFTDRGLIHIHTGKPELDLSVRGSLVLGNETKDAGPYRYTKYATLNVDRSANDGSLSIDLGKETWYARANLTVQKHPFTDFAMFERVAEIVNDWPGLHQSISPSLRVGVELLQGQHELLAGYPYSTKYFLFFKPSGREIPVKNAFPFIGMRGTFSATRTIDVTYRFKYSSSQLGEYPNSFDFDFDWKSSNVNANIESDFSGTTYQAKLGIGFDRFRLDTGYQLENDSYDIGKVYGELRFGLSKGIHQSLSTLVACSGGKTAVKVGLINDWEINSKHDLVISLSFSQRLFEEDNSLWYWTQRGYDLLRTNGIDYTIHGNIDRGQQFTGDLIWKIDASEDLTIETTGSYRFFTDLYLERQTFQFDPLDCSFSSPVQIHGGEEGQVFGGKIAVRYRFRPHLSQQLFYSYWTEISGGDVFRDTWATVPKHKASYQIAYTPVENFAIWAMVSYRSATSWSDYLEIDGQTCATDPRIKTTYAAAVKEAAIFDLQLQKWFWRRKLIGSILFRNLYNQNYRYHPVGASFDLSLYIKVEVFLDSQRLK